MPGDKVITYAQNREDVLLAGFFEDDKKGFYVDIGAHEATIDSVTKYFYERGWRGINVEPNKALYDKLELARPEDMNVNVGIAEKRGELTLRIYDKGDGLSTFSDEMKQDYSKKPSVVTETYHDVTVPVITLKELFEEYKVEAIDFLKIDIEGYEYSALGSNDWERYRPTVLCIEANHLTHDWRPLLQRHEYTKVFFDGLNEYYVANEAKKTIERFSYVNAIIGRPIIGYRWSTEIQELADKSRDLKEQLQAVRKLTAELEQTNEGLKNHIHEQLRTKNLLKGLAASVDRVIVRNISKITRKPHYYPVLRHVTEKDDAKRLLEVLRGADQAAFAGSPGIIWKVKTGIGSAILFLYIKSRKLAGRIARKLFRFIRRIR